MKKVTGTITRDQCVLIAILPHILQDRVSAVIAIVQCRKTELIMRYCLFKILPAIVAGFFLASCSELETNVSQPQALTVHKEGISTPGHANFHGKLIRENGWDMNGCKQCHAADFSGGITQANCNTCHTGSRGPESCNTCHGSFSDPSRIAPPRDLENNTSTSVMGVGAHTRHIYENTIGNSVRCSSCHIVPQTLYAEGHMDADGTAEVVLKSIATAHGASNAAYNATDGSCSNTYCHGNFEFLKDSASAENRFAYTADKMTGTPVTVKWTNVDKGEAECGSCHGLPPAGHIQVPLSSCYTCHGEVVDEHGNIINKEKHIDGNPDARGN
jgi:predicted CxxxxCH...CXXCH cytochrome family protein